MKQARALKLKTQNKTTDYGPSLAGLLGAAGREGVKLGLPSSIPDEFIEGVSVSPDANFDRCVFEIKAGNFLWVCEGASLSRCSFHAHGNGNLIVVGPHARLKNVVLMASGDYSAVGVGAGTTWESGRGFASKNGRCLIIGRDCMFSNSVVLRTNDAHGIFDLSTQKLINPPEDVIVGEHVWLGNGVRVSKGSNVGRSSVVGQGAIVSGSVEAHSVYAGVPARKVKGGVTWSRSTDWGDIEEDYQRPGGTLQA